MLKRIRDFFLRSHMRLGDDEAPSSEDAPPPVEIAAGGATPFILVEHLAVHEGYPIVDWDAAQAWVDKLEPVDRRGSAWTEIERAWLLHMREALGSRFRLSESNSAMLMSALEPNVARATLDYMGRTLQRVVKVLDGIAQAPVLGKDLLIVFDDDLSYYRYVSCYYPEAGEFGLSSGMHINAACSHYVTVRGDLQAIEPVIAHEMTHGCLAHLPLPAWLNEGLAVNVENRLAGTRSTHAPQQVRAKHLAFWHEQEVQQFWSGKSFLRADDGNLLSYDLAHLIVEHMARNWEPFKRFVLAADGMDAGATAAREHLGVELGEFVCALLERKPSAAWSPDPAAWEGAPERGGFAEADSSQET